MKKLLPILIFLCGAAYVLTGLRPARNDSGFDLNAFANLPLVANGRIKPMDTVARTTLLTLQGRQRVKTADGHQVTPVAWLLDVFYRPEFADTYRTLTIDNLELQSLLGITPESTKITFANPVAKTMAVLGFLPSTERRFTYETLVPKLAELDRQAELALAIDAKQRTPFQRAVVELRNHVILYQQLKHTLVVPDGRDFLAQLNELSGKIAAGVAAVRARQAGEPFDQALAEYVMTIADDFARMDQIANALPIPPLGQETSFDKWQKSGTALLESFSAGQVNPYVLTYAGLGRAWQGQNQEQFNTILRLFHEQLDQRYPAITGKAQSETTFNQAEPFYRSLLLYVTAFLTAVFSWLFWPKTLQQVAFYLTLVAWIAATVGIITRMWLEGRPPVTNLYSSAIFVGWGSVALCLVLEYLFKNAIGAAAGGFIGFVTLIIAHQLSLSGDTLEMMRAVLDSNFWLATHVVIITIGYAATFLAGALAKIYIFRGTLTKSLDKDTARSLNRMVYGIVCFATLFSLVGTILGGIWADQSWGRFWGWDPKENGALIIVLWNAIILHARWGGLARERGIMALAVFGNIVTSWSWFGTNMLGVGLHSYGFMDSAFKALIIFIAIQLAFIALAYLPAAKWRSAEFLKRRAT